MPKKQKRKIAPRQWDYVLIDHQDLPEEERHEFRLRAPTSKEWDGMVNLFQNLKAEKLVLTAEIVECVESMVVDSTAAPTIAEDPGIEPHHVMELFLHLINRAWTLPALAKKNCRPPSLSSTGSSADAATGSDAQGIGSQEI